VQRRGRLVSRNLGLKRVGVDDCHVRGVRHDELRRLVNAVEQVALDEPDPAAHIVPIGISCGDVERGRGNVRRDDAGGGELDGQRDGEAAAAGADIDQASHQRARPERHRLFDHELSFGARNQHVARDFEVQPPEFPVTGDVGDWLAFGAPGDERLIEAVEGRRDGVAAAGDERRAVAFQDVPRQDLRVERRFLFRNPRSNEALARFGEPLVQRRHQRAVSAAVASFNFSDVK
jgi:hypothetical protein